MSRIAKQPIVIPTKTDVTFENGVLTVSGPQGKLSRFFRDEISLVVENNTVAVTQIKKSVFARALVGTYASHVKNMIAGVNTPYEKKLILEGVGFKSEVAGADLKLALGFSHPVVVPIPEGLTVTAEKNNIVIKGIDKELVGSFSAMVRGLKKPEPYKGKGFRYSNEVILRKQGKKSV